MIAEFLQLYRPSLGTLLRPVLQYTSAWGVQDSSLFAVKSVTRQVYSPIHWPVSLTADWYHPHNSELSSTVVVLIHGGSWRSGRPDGIEMTGLASFLASHGLTVIAPKYRLAPTWLHPNPLEDLHMLLDRLPGLCKTQGLTIQHISLWGYSAGAHLAAMLGLQRSAAEIKAVVTGGLPADLSLWPRSPIVASYLGVSAAQDPGRARQASPLYNIDTSAPPFFLYHGTADTLVEPTQSLLMVNQLSHQGVHAICRMIPGYGHIGCALHPGPILRDALDFLRHPLTLSASY